MRLLLIVEVDIGVSQLNALDLNGELSCSARLFSGTHTSRVSSPALPQLTQCLSWQGAGPALLLLPPQANSMPHTQSLLPGAALLCRLGRVKGPLSRVL